MKKILALLLAAAMCVTLAGCGAGKDDGANAVVLGPAEPQAPRSENGLLAFDLTIANPTTEALFIDKLEIIPYTDGRQSDAAAVFTESQLDYVGPLSGSIAPSGEYKTTIRRPALDAAEIVFTIYMHSEAGTKLLHRVTFNMTASSAPGTPADGDAPAESAVRLPEVVGSDWHFIIDLVNDTDSALTLQRVEVFHLSNGMSLGEPFICEGSALANLDLANCIIAPGANVVWDDWHPIVTDFDAAEYRFTFSDEYGGEVVLSSVFDLSGSGAPGSTPTEPPDGYLAPDSDGSSWIFPIDLVNDTDQPLTLELLEIFHLTDGTPVADPVVFTPAEFPNMSLNFESLAPGDSFQWYDGHPFVNDFNEAEYRFTFSDPNGGKLVKTFRYKLSTEASPAPKPTVDYSGDTGRDLETLRYDAAFELEVAPGVKWVPARTLGDSRYTNAEVYSMLKTSPEDKQNAVSTLYEALQFYQVGGFYSSDDNVRINENGVNWEHHKPGYDAVRTNTGCCATDSNWLNYILRGDYDEIGYIATSQRDGSGHIYNYLKQEGFYYFIDLTHYRTDWVATAVESGDLNDYYSSDFVLGNIHKTASVQAFVDYVQSAFGDPPGLMFQYTAENCLAIDSVRNGQRITITYEDAPGVHVSTIFDDPADALDHAFVTPPQNLPDWSSAKGFDFPA